MSLTGTELRRNRETLGLSQAKLAEISGVPQHLLSAFELGKNALSDVEACKVIAAFDSPETLQATIGRRKRYRQHVYSSVEHDPQRVARHAVTEGNATYLNLLRSQNTDALANRYAAISLFSGCGGLSLGFKSAGFDIRGHVEVEESSRAIYEKNFPTSRRIATDITAISDAEIAAACKHIGEIDAIIGGPPCQGFSLSGKRDVEDARNYLFMHYLRFVKAFRPKVAVLENVRLLTSMKSRNGTLVKDDIQRAFSDQNYSVDMYEVNAKNYGVPQHRERVFFVAIRRDLNIRLSFPQRTHGDGGDLLLNRWRSFADACSDLPYIESGEQSDDLLHIAVAHPQHVIDWLWDVPEGHSAHENADAAKRPPSGYNTTYKRQIWSEPGSTIQTTFGMISGCRNVHPIATRSLTIREAARIQSFPDNFIFEGTQGGIRTSIGNAVPPLLAGSVARHVATNILDLVKVSGF